MKSFLHLAWTVDDGPTKNTEAMISTFASAGAKSIPVTWFIQYDKLLEFPGALEKYKNVVLKKGHEIGLHGVSATANHIKWFPSGDGAPAYATVEQAITGITNFRNYLKSHGISVKFVRAPTGLVSELQSYLRKLNYKGAKMEEVKATNKKRIEIEKKIETMKAALRKATKVTEKKALEAQLKTAEAEQSRLEKLHSWQQCNPTSGSQARLIIQGKHCQKADLSVQKVALDYQTLLKALERQNHKLWGGDASGKVSPQSWEAESSGVKARTDDVPARINKMITLLGKGTRPSASFVILCHSTTREDVLEVKKDIAELESAAVKQKVQIRYHTMTSLYKQVVGVPP